MSSWNNDNAIRTFAKIRNRQNEKCRFFVSLVTNDFKHLEASVFLAFETLCQFTFADALANITVLTLTSQSFRFVFAKIGARWIFISLVEFHNAIDIVRWRAKSEAIVIRIFLKQNDNDVSSLRTLASLSWGNNKPIHCPIKQQYRFQVHFRPINVILLFCPKTFVTTPITTHRNDSLLKFLHYILLTLQRGKLAVTERNDASQLSSMSSKDMMNSLKYNRVLSSQYGMVNMTEAFYCWRRPN